MRWAVIDSSVYIGHWERGLFEDALTSGKRLEFQNDALIALTARRHGATVVTANREDFGLLSAAISVRVLYPM